MLGQGGTILKTKTGIRARLRYDADVRTFRQGFEISLINMLTALMEKVYSMQNKMYSFRRTMETIREIKQTTKDLEHYSTLVDKAGVGLTPI